MQSFLLVGLGGGLGAMARYGVGLGVGRVWSGPVPLATLLVNISGSLAMGLLVGLLARYTPQWQAEARLLLAVGLFGGFTTFSAFSLDAVTLIERGNTGLAVTYALVSVVLSVLALFVGLWITRSSGL